MDAEKFLETQKRMCNTTNCVRCPLVVEETYCGAGDCCAMEKIEEELMSPHEIVAAVEKWGEDNPPNTIAAELLKYYPLLDTNSEGRPIDICAHTLGYKEPEYCFDDDSPKSCNECWKRTPEEAAI